MYYVVYGFLWLVSLLPLRILYLFSDAVYGFLFYISKYRRDVVAKNLAQAFPEKSEKERLVIAKKFYHNLVDTFIETLKLFSSGKKFINRHLTADFTIINELQKQGKSFQIHAAHQFNWEWINHHYALNFKLPLVAVYMPLLNKTFEKIFYKMRTRYGTVMLPATDMRKSFIPWRHKQHALVLVADQNPGDPTNSYWVNFYNKPAPFVKGPERSARDKECPVVFVLSWKRGRGKYHTEFILSTDNAASMPETALTKKYAEFLTDMIREQPEMWLWSHRRWKWEWKPEYGEVISLKSPS